MSKEKQIEKMARDLQRSEHWCFNESSIDFELDRRKTAENLYNAGYRKQSDGEQLVNEIFDEVEKCVIGTIEPSFIQLRDKYIAKMKGGEDNA